MVINYDCPHEKDCDTGTGTYDCPCGCNEEHNPQGLTPNNKIKTALTPVGVDAFVQPVLEVL